MIHLLYVDAVSQLILFCLYDYRLPQMMALDRCEIDQDCARVSCVSKII